MSTIAELQVRIGADMKDFTRGMAKVQSSIDKMGQKFSDVGASMSRVGASLTRSVTLPLVAATVGVVKLGTDFETSLAKIENLVGESKEQVGMWKDEMLKLAPAVGIGPTAWSDALFVVTSAGAATA